MAAKRKPPKYITTPEAVAIAAEEGISITRMTVRTYCEKYDIGIQLVPGGKWHVDEKKFRELIRGKNKTGRDTGRAITG